MSNFFVCAPLCRCLPPFLKRIWAYLGDAWRANPAPFTGFKAGLLRAFGTGACAGLSGLADTRLPLTVSREKFNNLLRGRAAPSCEELPMRFDEPVRISAKNPDAQHRLE